MAIAKLKELIKGIRACKTAADERALIAKESAQIRTQLKEDNVDARYTTVAKLLYIHMLGYPAHFGQIECLKLVSSPRFAHKRLGYLGIMLLLDENQEVLTLVTNSLKNDMNHTNMYIIGLALCTLGNISSIEMARDLSGEVERLLGSSNSYIRKKAALCALRIVRKVPDLHEHFIGRCRTLLSERHHGVLMTGVSLIAEMCKSSPDCMAEYRKSVPAIVKILKALIGGGNGPEHDVSGVADPFLQVQILRLLRILGTGDQESSDAMNDILAQVATNTDGSKNVGNSILYETVLTILDIQADNSLRVLAINILGRFLTFKDNNVRYVALNTLVKTIDIDNSAVQRHRGTIIDCFRDPDISIRRRALELAFALINEATVRVLVRELLIFLERADLEFKNNMVTKLCQAADKFSPNRRWYIETVLKVLKVAGGNANDDIVSNLIKLVANNPDIQHFTVNGFFEALKADSSKEWLNHAALWLIGEYGEYLTVAGRFEEVDLKSYSEGEVINVVADVLKSSLMSSASKEYAINALAKLTVRYSNQTQNIGNLIVKYQSNLDIEIQQRANEYVNLLRYDNVRNALLDKIPPPAEKVLVIKDKEKNTQAVKKTQQSPLDILSEIESLAVTNNAPKPNPAQGGVDLMADIFGSIPKPQIQESSPGSYKAYEKNGLTITFNPVKDQTDPSTINIEAIFQNTGASQISDLVFQVAVPKSMKLALLPPSGTTIPPQGFVKQILRVNNPTNVPPDS